MMQPPQEEVINTYRRAARGLPPRFDRKRIADFLASASWIPLVTMPDARIPAQSLTFMVASRIRRVVPPTTNRVVLIRDIERRDGRTYVNVDGDYFVLERCGRDACLTRSPGLPELPEVPVVPVDGRFAQPPP